MPSIFEVIYLIDQDNLKIKIIIPDSFRGKINQSHIRWNDHKGDYIFIKANDEIYNILIKNVDTKRQIIYLSSGDKEVSITMVAMNNKLIQQGEKGFCDAGKLLYLINDNVLCGGNKLNKIISFKYPIGTHIKNDKNDYILTDIYVKKDQFRNRKYYNMHCNKCGWDGYISETAVDKNSSCLCCSKGIVVVGINDIATTDSWAIKYFVNECNGYEYHNTSNEKIDMRCPICGQIYKDVCIKNFFNNIYHLNCPCNKTYASYPERFVFNMMKMIGVDNIIPQASKKDLSWADNFRYDFYISDKSCIIETHGIQHYKNTFDKIGGRTYEQEQENDEIKKSFALSNGIRNYIILDCRKSDINWIKSSIMNSPLPSLMHFTEYDIDWVQCDKNSKSELFLDICDTYMNDISSTRYSLAKSFGIKPDTVRRYLIKGTDLLICNYDGNSIREKLSNHTIDSVIFIYKDGILIRVCSGIYDLHQKSLEIFGKVISVNKIHYSIKRNLQINGFTIIRNTSINSYQKYIDFLCDPNNYYFP